MKTSARRQHLFPTLTGFFLLVFSSSWPGPVLAQDQPPANEFVLTGALAIDPVGRSGRSAVHTDAIEKQIVLGTWSAPHAGDEVTLPDGTSKKWKSASAADDGWLQHRGYVFWSVESPREQVMLLEAAGHSMVYVNGEPRAGDPYRTNKVRLPVVLRAGANELLFRVGRGRVKARLVEPESPIILDTRDLTLPDVIPEEVVPAFGALVVVNARMEPLADTKIGCFTEYAGLTLGVSTIPALSTRKVLILIPGYAASSEEGKMKFNVEIRTADGTVLAQSPLILRSRGTDQRHKRTFISEIDGSVQYYAVTPAHPDEGDDKKTGLVLTLHGAGVEATGQANAYGHKSWVHIVAPTNRRHFGFDWEDWGRIDAIEVLNLAQQQYDTDPQRTYLTGHSMGGHGAWQLGVHYPDRFAAIAPSAGWISFASYTGAARFENATPIEAILRRAAAPSDTLALSRNYLQHGVYILHGERDDNVPVDQARTMRKHLAEYHADFAYYERPGAGHWWGNACVDWPPLFDFFKAHTRPEPHAVRHVEFVTANPAVSASSHWVTIEAQQRPLEPAKVDLHFDPKNRRFHGTTDNVARLSLDLSALSEPRTREKDGEMIDTTPLPPGKPLTIELDDQSDDAAIHGIAWPENELRIWLTRDDEGWSLSSKPSPALKGPHRYGPFKEAFRNRVMFVYGTIGNAQENAWTFAKARYDAETFWYRGNASIDVVRDIDFESSAEPDRNVILYGNADTNSAWAPLLGESPVQVRRGAIRVGKREWKGDDLACLFLRPRPGSGHSVVGVVSGSGLPGMRLTERLPYFVSGVAYPDCIVMTPDVLSEGTAGIRAAGFFGIDWSVEQGDFAFRAPKGRQ